MNISISEIKWFCKCHCEMQFSIVFLYQDDEQPDDLSFPDNNEDDDSLENLKLLWHGEIEEKLDKAHPLLCTMIYDSCR